MGFSDGGMSPFRDGEGGPLPGQLGLPCGLLTNCATMSLTALWLLREGSTGLTGPEHPAGGQSHRPEGLGDENSSSSDPRDFPSLLLTQMQGIGGPVQ